MPAQARDGGFLLVICTGDRPMLAVLDGGQDGGAQAPACTLAHAAPAPAPGQGLPWTLPDGTAVAATARAASEAPTPLAFALASHLPRGPPTA